MTDFDRKLAATDYRAMQRTRRPRLRLKVDFLKIFRLRKFKLISKNESQEKFRQIFKSRQRRGDYDYPA